MSDTVVKQGGSAHVEVTFTDYDDATVAAADLLTVHGTLYDRSTGTVINSRTNVDVVGSGWGSVDSETDILTIELGPDDNPVLDTDCELEVHVLALLFTYNTGSGETTGVSEVSIPVVRVTNLPSGA